LDGWGESKQTRRGENDTDRLPEEILGPLLGWALRFIDDFASDILAADQKWQASRNPRPTSNRPRNLEARLTELVTEYVEAKRPLPGHRGRPNLSWFGQALNCHMATIHIHRAILDEAAKTVGVTDSSCLDTEVRGRLGNRPWVATVTTHHTAANSLARLARHLQSACYVVIAFLSGMRDSDVKHMRRGCLHIQRDEDGTPYRWRVHSLAFKGEDDTAGVPATWVVGEPVARAITALEALLPDSLDYLFARLPHGPGSRKGTQLAIGTKTTNKSLNEFAVFVNQLCRDHDRVDVIPAGPGHAFRLRTGHFRRTLAWFIARHPGGTIAGAMQYRHHSIQMFEGYAGTSDSGFRAEVESEQAITRGEGYMEMIEAHQYLDLAGPSAEEAARRLKDFGDRAQFQGQVGLDKHRLRRIMKRNDPAIYPGEYITCVNDPAKALCEKARRGNSEGLPYHGGCLPLACRNVALTPENVAAWQRVIARIDKRFAARPTLPPLRRQFLENRRAEVVEFLTTNGQEVVPA
jgi:integrase